MLETVIGLEIHIELNTKSKAFCSCKNSFAEKPNTSCCPVCMGMPGALPTLNREVVKKAVALGLSLGCKIRSTSTFDRKNYFYPDLPKAYQITQFYSPICYGGEVKIETENSEKSIRIKEIHIEEDAGKLFHSETENKTLIDYNRCGVPLLEIVTEPDFRTAKEVTAFSELLKSICLYRDISDCKMQEGSLRVDLNLSVHEKGEPLGTRTEMKNLNSFKAIEHAIKNEAERQSELIKAGKPVICETRRFDDKKGVSVRMRDKESVTDYRYFHEPDIPPLSVSDEYIKEIEKALPETAADKEKRFISEFSLTEDDARLLSREPFTAEFFEKTVRLTNEPQEVRYWTVSGLAAILNASGKDFEDLFLTPNGFAEFIKVALSGKITRSNAKELLSALVISPKLDIMEYIKANGFEVCCDEGRIEAAVKEVLLSNEKAVLQYKNGDERVVGFFIGQALKKLNGNADPGTVTNTVKKELKALGG